MIEINNLSFCLLINNASGKHMDIISWSGKIKFKSLQEGRSEGEIEINKKELKRCYTTGESENEWVFDSNWRDGWINK